jgi:S1-C subfamily serine protease
MPCATGLTFELLSGFDSQPFLAVSRVLESSAAKFAGIMVGDVLLQIDDRIVSGVDDGKR